MNVIVFLLAALVLVPVPGLLRTSDAVQPVAAMADVPAELVGTWVRERRSGSTYQKITLSLRADATYTKVLTAQVNGAPYGGTHDGTWTAQGTTVTLSGDGNWPRISHDLSEFTKID